jgi:predicted nicotinamide N-methyase
VTGATAPKNAARGRRDPRDFIVENTRLESVPLIPEIRLHTAHQATGLWRLAEAAGDVDPPPPYWAFPWAGGMALARYVLAKPETVAGRRVLDLGSGSGLVAIAAMKAGARSAIAADIDPYAAAAIALNAEANGVDIALLHDDITAGAPSPVDLILVGDLFYERDLALRVTAFLDRALIAGIAVLIGDPGRAYLPRERLVKLAEYPVPDVGEVEGSAKQPSAVFAFGPG